VETTRRSAPWRGPTYAEVLLARERLWLRESTWACDDFGLRILRIHACPAFVVLKHCTLGSISE
jgi:hypothetical protein